MNKEEMGKKVLCCMALILEKAIAPGSVKAKRYVDACKLVVDETITIVGEQIPFTDDRRGKDAVISACGSMCDAIGRLQVVDGMFSEKVFNKWVKAADKFLH